MKMVDARADLASALAALIEVNNELILALSNLEDARRAETDPDKALQLLEQEQVKRLEVIYAASREAKLKRAISLPIAPEPRECSRRKDTWLRFQFSKIKSRFSPHARATNARIFRQARDALGAGLINVGQAIHEVRRFEQHKADRTALLDADMQADAVANDLYIQAQNHVGKDAIGIAPKLATEYDKHTSEVEQSFKLDSTKVQWRERNGSRRNSFPAPN